MGKPLHSAKLPFPLNFRGQDYSSLSDLWKRVSPVPVVSIGTVSARLKRRVEQNLLSNDIVAECLWMSVADYKAKYSIRKTWIPTAQGERECSELYAEFEARVSYSCFRQRLVAYSRRNDVEFTDTFLREAAQLCEHDWTVHYGGGRRQNFFYDGDLYPEHRGHYTGFTSFLKRIGRWEDRERLHARRKARWDIDDLLREPPMRAGQAGYIYKITEKDTGRVYVGLSVNSPKVRFHQHLKSSRCGSTTPLHLALSERGMEGFDLETLERVEGNEADLSAREKYWIDHLNCFDPVGLNVRKGGAIGRYDGITVKHDGKTFPSLMARDRAIAEEKQVPLHIVQKYMKSGVPIPEKPRKCSTHPDAGSDLFSQYLGLKRRSNQTGHGIEPVWENYDNFKADILALKGDGQLTRIDVTLPWGPNNVCYMDRQSIVERTHAKAFTVGNKTWPSIAEALREYNIPRNVYLLRLKNGWSEERALTEPLGKNRKKEFSFMGVTYPSKSACYRTLAIERGKTPDQIKDYIRRGLFIEKWP